jgi:membrane-bound metal-dependent hydrolase YbcI (DUF457 family)
LANFTTHLNVAAFVSGIAAVSVSYTNLSTPKDAFLYFLAGIVGGILPDIDHNNSIPIKILQFFLSNLIAFLIIVRYLGKYPILNILFLWIVSYISVNILFFLFKKLTTHRGIIHSIPAAFFFFFLVSLISYKYFGLNVLKSYLIGLFVFIGYITHLILDEVYSVDITGRRIKKSFGSAFKLYSYNKKTTFFMYLLIILIFIFLPKKDILFHIVKGLINV